jgi:hypothetical protein
MTGGGQGFDFGENLRIGSVPGVKSFAQTMSGGLPHFGMKPLITWKFALFAVLGVGICQFLGADEGVEFFEKKIRPVLVENCYKCHSAQAKKLKAGLYLDRKAGWEMGGESGPVVIPGKPEQSRLLLAIRFDDNDLRMPKAGKLPGRVVKDFEKWILMGAPDPRDEPLEGLHASSEPRSKSLEDAREFWSFKPLGNREPPEVRNEDWPVSGIDRFVLQKLEERGLEPAKPADKATLLRRVYFDLTGLPPTPGQIDAFLDDPSNDAFAKVVDRLLGTKQFAERWARHWLDVARYADTTGGGRNIAFKNAYRYRDFVLESYAADKPFDLFVRQQIAGDLLPSDSDGQYNENLVGTTFLALGPHNYELQDKELLRMEIVDEQIEAVGRAFLGLTMGCARCHDHPFDPVPTKEYYSMAGIFRSTESMKVSNVADFIERPLRDGMNAERERHEEQAKVLSARLKGLEDELKKLNGGKPLPKTGNGREKMFDTTGLEGILVDDSLAKIEGTWTKSTHSPYYIGEGYLHDEGQRKTGQSVTWTATIPEAGKYDVQVSYAPGPNRSVNAKFTVKHDVGEETVVVNQQEEPPILGTFISLGKYHFEEGKCEVVRLGTEGTRGVVIADALRLLPVKAVPSTLQVVAKPKALVKQKKEADEGKQEKTKALKGEIAELKKEIEAHKKAAPPTAPMAMSVNEHTESGDWHVHLRGGIRNLGEKVKRGFLEAATPAGQSPMPDIQEGASGRLELANWVASPDNPLTARVYANRVWQHLFGRGIAPTTDNFGETGQRPTHPELLDYLAVNFIANGWSTKKLVREIVLSQSYRMSSTPQGRAWETDPENQLFSRQNRRRLQVESIRDTILVSSGKLDPGTENLGNRSMYAKLDRNNIPEMYDIFDFPNPNLVSGTRNASTVPTQALFLMNNRFILEEAAAAAKLLMERDRLGLTERLDLAYKTTLGRLPDAQEKALALEYLGQENKKPDEPETWAAIFHSLYACLDFRYLN